MNASIVKGCFYLVGEEENGTFLTFIFECFILSEMITQINWYDGPTLLELVEVAVVFVDGSFLEEEHSKRAKADILTKNKMKVHFKKNITINEEFMVKDTDWDYFYVQKFF